MAYEDDYVFVCMECKSDQSWQAIYKSPWGEGMPCKYCGGKIAQIARADREHVLESMDRDRGIDRTAPDF
jgi:DNA-directed RNA polymerase subunit RPC12/RpoP